MSRLYTKTGDHGMTYLYDGSRRKKSSTFFDVLGDVDELSSHIGLLCSIIIDTTTKKHNSLYMFFSNLFNNDKFLNVYTNIFTPLESNNTELNSNGVDKTITILRTIQVTLLDIGSNIAVVDITKKDKVPTITKNNINQLEVLIDLYDTIPLNEFVLTGVSQVDSQCHVCRSVCRRAERCMWKLTDEVDIDEHILQYMNRLSDFFFAFSRYLSNYAELKVSDIKHSNIESVIN